MNNWILWIDIDITTIDKAILDCRRAACHNLTYKATHTRTRGVHHRLLDGQLAIVLASVEGC